MIAPVLERSPTAQAVDDPDRALALAVIQQAFEDLDRPPGPEPPRLVAGRVSPTWTKWVRRDRHYRDTVDFLTHRLWEPACVWRERLDDVLPRDIVLREVRLRTRASRPCPTCGRRGALLSLVPGEEAPRRDRCPTCRGTGELPDPPA